MNVRFAIPPFAYATLVVLGLAACETAPKVHVEREAVTTGEDVVVAFDSALRGRATNQYWVALQPAAAPVDDTTGRVVLQRSDRVVRLRATTPGEFEVRLHGAYPEVEHHLLARIPVKVDGWHVKTGSEPRIGADECLDGWLAARQLDPYGHPTGTIYAGGTPLFDPTSGVTSTRWDYVVTRVPEASRACERPGSSSR